eukprot:TRINITY_DN8873_c0_g1_i1.p1 TRINITY_DN8873_c0_g1~~TRINITY_DN8873_c0_g1_i1.p1  ORF type:complete len:335 (-),score=55.14 TRINITY_DN8873_c0_g1_i1:1546-2550(-)
MKEPLLCESEWAIRDTLYAQLSSVAVSLDTIVQILLACIFLGTQNDVRWGAGILANVFFRTMVMMYFHRGSEHEGSVFYRVCMLLQLNFIIDGNRCCSQKAYTSQFYWNKLLHATIQAVPISYANLYIILEEGEGAVLPLTGASVTLSIICITIITSSCNHAAMYRSGIRHFGSFTLRTFEVLTFMFTFGVFSHIFKYESLAMLVAKYLSAVLLIVYHNFGSDSILNLLRLAIFGGLLDTAIIWFSGSMPSSTFPEINRAPDFLVEDTTIASYSRSLFISNLFYLTMIPAMNFAVELEHTTEKVFLLIAAVTFGAMHVVFALLVWTHPKKPTHI